MKISEAMQRVASACNARRDGPEGDEWVRLSDDAMALKEQIERLEARMPPQSEDVDLSKV